MENLNKIQKIKERIIVRKDVKSFSVIGDPGCEGLGTVMLQTYASALMQASENDMILVVGDLVPIGEISHYNKICELTNVVSKKDVYVLRGNHDTGDYESIFGYYDYAIVCESFTIVILDNAFRQFSEEGLLLLKEILSKDEHKNVILAFHIPIPNHYTKNAVSEEELEKLKTVYTPWKEKIKYFVCGHVHSCFEDLVDEIPYICTGGGGAMIEDVSEHIKASDVEHHIVRFYYENSNLAHKFVEIGDIPYRTEIQDTINKDRLMESVKGELFAHLYYLTFAERAKRRGYHYISNLFQALAESEYRHARNFFTLLDRPESFDKTIETYIPNEVFEYDKLYKMMASYAEEQEFLLTKQAYQVASAAEKIHAKLMKEATELDEFSTEKLYVCSICGYIMEESTAKERCPACGAPAREYLIFDTSNQDSK